MFIDLAHVNHTLLASACADHDLMQQNTGEFYHLLHRYCVYNDNIEEYEEKSLGFLIGLCIYKVIQLCKSLFGWSDEELLTDIITKRYADIYLEENFMPWKETTREELLTNLRPEAIKTLAKWKAIFHGDVSGLSPWMQKQRESIPENIRQYDFFKEQFHAQDRELSQLCVRMEELLKEHQSYTDYNAQLNEKPLADSFTKLLPEDGIESFKKRVLYKIFPRIILDSVIQAPPTVPRNKIETLLHNLLDGNDTARNESLDFLDYLYATELTPINTNPTTNYEAVRESPEESMAFFREYKDNFPIYHFIHDRAVTLNLSEDKIALDLISIVLADEKPEYVAEILKAIGYSKGSMSGLYRHLRL